MPWTADLRSLDGASLIRAAAPFKSARITWSLDTPSGAAEFTLRGSDVVGGDWRAGRRRVLIKDGAGTARYQGWLDRLERGGTPGETSGGTVPLGPSWRAASRALEVHLDERVIHGEINKVSVVKTTVMWDLIAHAKAQTAGAGPNLLADWTLGAVTGVAGAVNRYYCDGDKIGERLRELAEGTPRIDWEIDAGAVFNAWVGGRGVDRTGTHSVGPDDCQSWECVEDTSDLRTYMTGLGEDDDDSPCGPPLVVDFSSDRDTYGRREDVITDSTDSESEMEELTTEAIRARVASRVNLRTMWIEGRGPWSFGAVWLGDRVTAELGSEFGGNASLRLISVSVTLESLYEFVEMEWEAA